MSPTWIPAVLSKVSWVAYLAAFAARVLPVATTCPLRLMRPSVKWHGCPLKSITVSEVRVIDTCDFIA
ncbi:hypothetical protein D9M71_738050 [compost metagenome]